MNPQARFLVFLRDPVERAWSAYWFWRRRKERNDKRFVEFEKMWADDGRWIKTRGLYADQLSYWREAFPDFGVFFYDDIKTDPVGLAQSLLAQDRLDAAMARLRGAVLDDQQPTSNVKIGFPPHAAPMVGNEPTRS